MRSSGGEGEKLIRVTAWVPKKSLAVLLKKQKTKKNRSEFLRSLIEDEAERLRSWQAHDALYGIAGKRDIDESLL